MQKKHAKSAKNVLLVSALAVALGACTTIETRYITPDCEVPPRPALPHIDAGILWDSVGDALYRDIEEHDARLTDWAQEMEASLRVLCGGEPAG